MIDKSYAMHPNLLVTESTSLAANLSIISSTVQPPIVLGENPMSFGSPIMGEDFITMTGVNFPRIA